MGMTRQEAELISELSEKMVKALEEVAETLVERIRKLEKKVEALESAPRTSLAQRLRSRGQA